MELEPVDDLEQAYLRALEATDAIEEDLASTLLPRADEDASEPRSESTSDDDPDRPAEVEVSQSGDARKVVDPPAVSGNEASPQEPHASPADPHGRSLDQESAADAQPHAEIPPRVSPRQIIEAALFVGGTPLTAKKLCAMLRGEYDLDFIEQTIDELNLQYVEEARPYEIRLGEGGYRLVLRPEFERVRNRVYGVVPKEVKLSQEVLEVLALVAYRQPVSKEDIENFGKSNPGGALRQLLRRELISIERGSDGRKDVRYHTTSRFLSLFGLSDLDELPQADELSFK